MFWKPGSTRLTKNCTDDPSLPTAEVALSPTRTRKIPRLPRATAAIAIVASSLYLPNLSLADSKSKSFYQRCPASQPLQHRKKLNKTGIGLRARRHYPTSTSMQMLSRSRPPPTGLPGCCQTDFHLPGERGQRSPNQWSKGKNHDAQSLGSPKKQPSQITLQ